MNWRTHLEARWPAVVFAVLLAAHFYLTTRNWPSGFLVGHEFRQAQTAISAHFIQQEQNFSLSYPTPVLGKPWSVPMEFPLYQWCVALLADATGWPIHVAGRTLSLAAFYLVLPGLWLLLASAGVPSRARWLSLGVVVCAPVHIFYSRAVLIESFALAFAVWHLAAFCRWMTRGSKNWLWIAVLCGVGAALVKVTTAMVWLSVAGAITLGLAWAARRESWRASGVVFGRAAAAALGPVIAALWWVNYADRVKELSPAGRGLLSRELQSFNFGHWADRFDHAVLQPLFTHWQQAVSPLWLSVPIIVWALWVGRERRGLMIGSFLVGVAAAFTFIQLYRWHDYYFYAIACAPLVATGLAVSVLEATPRFRAAGIGAFVLVCAVQLFSYGIHYGKLQRTPSNGGSGLTNVLRDVTPRDSVIIVVGRDWSSVLPYYAQRRALMLTDDRLDDSAYLDKAAANLAGEDISALVIAGKHRSNTELRASLAKRFGIAEQRAFSDPECDVYAGLKHHDTICRHLERYRIYDQVVLRGRPAPAPEPKAVNPLIADNAPHDLNAAAAREHFPQVSPAPHRYACRFGFGQNHLNDVPVVGAHPDSALWVRIPVGAKSAEAGFGLPQGSHEGDGDLTDGVRFEVVWVKADGTEQALLQRDVRPATETGDRGTQLVRLDLPTAAAGELIFRTHPIGTYSRDWAYWTHIKVQ